MSLTQFKRAAVGDQLLQLAADVAGWKRWPTTELPPGSGKRPFADHELQLARVTAFLEHFTSRLQGTLEAAGDLGALRVVERRVMGARKVWHYFRDKFAQRNEPALQPTLALADDFAWACYKPAWTAASAAIGRAGALASPDKLKGQPLLYLHQRSSPMAIPGDLAFAPLDLEQSEQYDDELLGLMGRIPIPVIGVPWFQVDHLPQAVLIAHEVGHLLVQDFDLAPALAKLVDSLELDAQRSAAWRAWIEECFCDVCATASSGAAYGLALMLYVAGERDAIARESRAPGKWGSYPTRQLRMHLVFHALEQLGLDVALGAGLQGVVGPVIAARSVRAFWEAELGSEDAMPSDYRRDAERIADALISTNFAVFQNQSLRTIAALQPDDMRRAGEYARRYVSRKKMTGNAEDLRVALASATLAYVQCPEAWSARNVEPTEFLELMRPVLAGSTRAAAAIPKPEHRSIAELDTAAAAAMFDELDRILAARQE